MEKFEIVRNYQNFNNRLIDITKVIKPSLIEQEISNLEDTMSQSDFWNNPNDASKVIAKSKVLKEKLTDYQMIKDLVEELLVLIELDDEELFTEAETLINELSTKLTNYEISLLLNGKYDQNNAIVEIHPGAGGTESQDWALMLYRMYKRYTERKKFNFELVDYQEGTDAGLKSVTFIVGGVNAYGYLKGEKGVHRLIRISPFDSGARRHTSFVGINVYPEVNEDSDIEISQDELRIDTYRSSGAGGQHVNTTDSAVRITHLPTGIVVSCQNERSQIQNRERAMQVLKAKLYQLKNQEILDEVKTASGVISENAFGSQIRTYTLHPYSLVKDHRTNIESGNPTSVLDGNLDDFINGYLQKIKSEE